MKTEEGARRDIDALLAGVLIVCSAVLFIPMINALLTIADSFESGSILSSPTIPMVEMFLLCVEGAIVLFAVTMAYSIISQDRRWRPRRREA